MALPTLEEIFASDTAGILKREPAAARPKVSSAEERILQIMEDVNAFHAEHGRLPDADATDRDERGRARRLRSAESENAELLKTVDRCGYFSESADVPVDDDDDDDDDLPSMDEIMASSLITDNNIYAIQDRGQAPQTRVANEEAARRQPCDDFDRFRPAFNVCHAAVDAGDARYVEFPYGGKIKEGDFFVLSGQLTFVAEIGNWFSNWHCQADARARLIFSNGTESWGLLRSLERSLGDDENGRRVIFKNSSPGPLFDHSTRTGVVYVVKSLSKRPVVQEHEGILFKIGTTRGHVKDRIARSTRETTYLSAPVEVVAEFEIHGYVPKDVEGLMHKFFEAGRADVRVEDERKHASKPSEWFFATPSLISQAMRLLNEGQLLEHEFDLQSMAIRRKLEPH